MGRIETMVTTSVGPKITTNAHENNKTRTFHDLLADQLMTMILHDGKPVTAWEVAPKLGDGYAEQASAILDGLTAEGILARFRAGFNDYYASPTVALTMKEPTPVTVILDSLKSLFLSHRYKVLRRLKLHMSRF